MLGGDGQPSDDVLVFVCAGWWVVAAAIGSLLGRRAPATPPIARVLADAKNATMLPEHRPGSVLINRLWPLLLSHGGRRRPGRYRPQVPASPRASRSSGRWPGASRTRAVQAIEERDGVTFYVERTSPVRPMQLVRIPGFRREVPSLNGSR